ncbi:DoxX family protein [Avrilella dinanensis]|uniref:DoxX-like family protein n=1 Tax=Avrilella dinanensis TaxID=2008672 RepID=A0A2M9R2N3_9FLAO|nr:DoxX family protein [Avrilella dinanensis]PJR03114.1 DoxX-like family protein [Avrilella dinanensis]
MTKRNKIIYWTATIFLSLGMLAGGIQQMLQIGGYNEIVTRLGYPLYLLSIIGTWKILGVVAILLPKFPLLKEWAYAGFFFVMTGAAISHLAVGQPFVETIPSLVLLVAIILSWYFRPTDRKIIINNK